MPKLTNTTAFPAVTSHTDDALVYIVNDSAGSPISNAVQVQNLGQGALTRDFGPISVASNTNSQTVIADTWTKLTKFDTATAGLQNGVTAIGTDAHYLRPSVTGSYRCHYSASITSSGSAATIHTKLYMGTSGEGHSQSAHKLASNYTGNFTATTIIDIADITSSTGTAGDISLWVKSTHTAIILSNARIVIERLINT